MEELKEKTVDLADHIEDLANTYYRLTIATATQKASNIVSGVVVAVVLCALGFFVLLFAGLALGWWLGDMINSRAGGFLLAAAVFFIIMLGISLFRKKTLFPLIRNTIIRKMYD